MATENYEIKVGGGDESILACTVTFNFQSLNFVLFSGQILGFQIQEGQRERFRQLTEHKTERGGGRGGERRRWGGQKECW